MRAFKNALFLVFAVLIALATTSPAQEKTETRYQLVLTNDYYDNLVKNNGRELCVLVVWGTSIDIDQNKQAVKVVNAYFVGLTPSSEKPKPCATNVSADKLSVFELSDRWLTAFLIEYRRSLFSPLRQIRYMTVYGRIKSKNGASGYELIRPKTKCGEDKCGEMDSILGFGKKSEKKSEQIPVGNQ